MPIKIYVFLPLVPLLAGCFDQNMPEVNGLNCQDENISNIEDKNMQQDFASKCLRRGKAVRSPEKSW